MMDFLKKALSPPRADPRRRRLQSHRKSPPKNKQRGGGGSTTGADPEKLKWDTIGGAGNRALVLTLYEGDRIVADGNTMAYMDADLKLETNMGKLRKAFGRWLAGEEFFLNFFTGTGPHGQKIVFSTPLPTDVQRLVIEPGQSWKVTRDGFLAGSANLIISGKLNAKGILPFGQEEGFVLTELSAPDDGPAAVAWLAAAGQIEKHEIPEGRAMLVDNENFVACSSKVSYKISKVGGFKSLVFGGEGLAMRFTGPCEVYTQTRGPRGIMREIAKHMPGKKSSKGVAMLGLAGDIMLAVN
jgi:uncharacterized protein (TIGR00266 family)